MKIQLWLLLNLVVLGVALAMMLSLQFQLHPSSPLLGRFETRLEAIGELIRVEVVNTSREQRDAILARYTQAYGIDFYLFENTGSQLAGVPVSLPDDLTFHLLGRNRPAPPPSPPGGSPHRHPIFKVQTSNPTRYWVGIRVPVMDETSPEPVRATLLAASNSANGNGLFFDPLPWVSILLAATGFSILFWLPMVRHITTTISQLTTATEQIADGQFEVRVDESRTDELGRLSKAINHLATRLSGYVTGQRRFMGDIAHELCSPIGRIQLALGILDARIDPGNRSYVEDLEEEVNQMSKLVNELLTFSKAGLKPEAVQLQKVRLLPLVKQITDRESGKGVPLLVEIPDALQVEANPALLSRAVSNIVRNAIRYAGHAGPVKIITQPEGARQVRLSVIDSGPGVPEGEVSRLFDPFYRIERDRARSTGGAGLGLAIVKSCVESFQASVSARNLKPKGFEVSVLLKTE
jgi:two-component system sensor histidine kinase CpxA